MFAVMFADVGHGIFILLFALLLIKNEDKLSGMKLNEVSVLEFQLCAKLFPGGADAV